jgi:hypothetical protein
MAGIKLVRSFVTVERRLDMPDSACSCNRRSGRRVSAPDIPSAALRLWTNLSRGSTFEEDRRQPIRLRVERSRLSCRNAAERGPRPTAVGKGLDTADLQERVQGA